jgi:outer membrane protein OmpA-like peptidoglycan-associated protein
MNKPMPDPAHSPAPPRSAPARLRSPWVRRALAGVLVAVVALLLFVTYALPGIVRTQAERIVAEKLHRQLTIARVEIHPFSLGVALFGVHLMEADGRTVFAAFDNLDVRVSPASLLHLAPVIREVHLGKPYVHIARTGPGRYSTDDIVATLAALPKGPPAPPDAPPARFSVNNIQVDGGRFVFDDVPNNTQHDVVEFSLGLPFISSFPSEEEVFVEPHLSAVIDGAPLHLSGEARPFAPTREAALAIDVDNLDLTRYLDYLPSPPPVHLPTGLLDLHLKLNVTLARDQPPHLAVAGKVVLRSMDIRSTQGKPLFKLDKVELAIDQANVPAGPVAATLTVNERGRLSVSGDTALSPLHARLAVAAQNLDLLPLQPLFADRVNLRLTRAELAAKGDLVVDQAAGGPLTGNFAGDLALNKVAAVDSVNSNDFINWDALSLRGIQARLSPLNLHVDEVDLDKLYARVIISPEGRINLQDIVREKTEAKKSLTDSSAAAPAPKRPAPEPAPAAPAPASASASASAATSPSAPASGAAPTPAGLPTTRSPAPPVSIGKVVIAGGHVRFSDNFIKPRYGADLLDLAGTVSGLSSDPASRADVDVHGKVNDAPLLIGGHVNPLARDLSLDIKASVHDMELAPLSPYSTKYVGYRIERGKLSFDVAYQLANRQLQAQNRLVLDQLTFGEKVESPTATSLPVQLAVALLKDRDGVIDINLPIGGSLDDPEFSVGGVIVRVLVNLITKAVTAPFALLGNLFGGSSEELSSLDFDPGQDLVTPEREASLKSLAKGMTERPGLKLDITGWADPVADREALRHRRVDARLRALKRQDLAAHGAPANPADVAVTPTEYPALLARAYKSDVPAKAPSTAAANGTPPAPKGTPTPAEMEQALAAVQQVSDDDLRTLGNRRAQAAKDWLRTIGLVPEERLALVGSKLGPAGAPDAAAAPNAKSTRVEFGLR